MTEALFDQLKFNRSRSAYVGDLLSVTFVSDIAIFVLKRDVKLQLTNSYQLPMLLILSLSVKLFSTCIRAKHRILWVLHR